MIKSVELKNIQSHKHSFLEFSPYVNMIVGNSNKGKSAIINGLLLPIQNRPLGLEIMSWNAKFFSSKITLDDGIVELHRGTVNQYILNEDEENSFKAFGTKVPDEIERLFNMDEKINIQRQIEESAIFLLSESPGEVAKFFNRVVGLDLIDFTLSNGKTDIKRTSNLVTNKQIQIKEKEAELEKYNWVEELYPKVLKAEELEKNIKSVKTKINNSKELLDKIEILINDIKQKENFLKVKTKVKKAEIILGQTDQAKAKLKRIKDLSANILSIRTKIKKMDKIVQIKYNIDRANNIFSKIEKTQKTKTNLLNRISIIKEKQKIIQTLMKEKKEVEIRLKKEMPDICILCGSQIR